MINDLFLAMIDYFGKDVKRINHAIKVHSFARSIALAEGLSEKERLIVEGAGILHDIGIKEAERKHNSSAGKYQEIEGPPVAKKILEGVKNSGVSIDDEIIERICFLTGNHHSYQKMDGIDFQILIEADFLVNIYEDQIKDAAVRSIAEKFFKTDTGRHLINKLYSEQ